jgi:DNA-directed RNA polymerase beta' subunit
VVTSEKEPKFLSDLVACENTLFDPRMGPRYEGDTCGTCGKSYEACKLGHFGLIYLGEFVYFSKYVPYLARAMRGVCRVCFRAVSKNCEKTQGKCVPYGSVKESAGPYMLTVDGEVWSAGRAFEFFARVPHDEWPKVKGWESTSLPQHCLFDRILVLSNSHRPSMVARSKSRELRMAHRHTKSYAKILKIANRMKRMNKAERLHNMGELHTAVNELLIEGNGAKTGEGIMNSLTSKEGLIRGNLMGKRVDFCARAVVIGNPSLKINEFGVPEAWRNKLTQPERVCAYNRQRIRAMMLKGEWTTLIKAKTGVRYDVDLVGWAQTERLAAQLDAGDVVDLWLQEGDPVILNRQPTLFTGSMMRGWCKIMPGYTIQMNVNATTPYNGDFDGDEYNAFVSRTENAKSEYVNLYGVEDQIVNANGDGQIYCMQNAALGAYLMTKDNEMHNLPYFTDANVTENKMRSYTREVWHDQGGDAAVEVIQNLSNAANEYLEWRGASLGLNEFDCSRALDPPRASDGKLLREQKAKVQELRMRLREDEDPLRVFNEAVVYMKQTEVYDTALRDMRVSGCKGNATNELNVALVIGAQSVCDEKPKAGLGGRVLPCEFKAGRGFISTGYLEGLRPEDTAVHQMSGRYDIYTKSVGVKVCGRRFRELAQTMENLVIRPGGVVCDAGGNAVQLQYGEDGFDPKYVRKQTGLPVLEWDRYQQQEMEEIPEEVRQLNFASEEYFAGKTHAPKKLLREWARGVAPYGMAVGIIAAQSIGEPATQETLNKFHRSGEQGGNQERSILHELFKGTGGSCRMSLRYRPPLLLSVDRKSRRPEAGEWGERWAQMVNAQPFPEEGRYLVLRFESEDVLRTLSLIQKKGIRFRSSHPAVDGSFEVHVVLADAQTECDLLHAFKDVGYFKGKCGEKCAFTCLEGARISEGRLVCEAKAFSKLLGMPYVDATISYVEDAGKMAERLGIDAAREMLMRAFMKSFQGKVDRRHVTVLVDAMTYTGSVSAADFYGFRKTQGESVMGLVCFERALEAMIHAAVSNQPEKSQSNISAAVVTGGLCALGTGAVHVENVAVDEDELYARALAGDGDWVAPLAMSKPLSPKKLNEPSSPSPPGSPGSPRYRPSSPDYRPSSPDYRPSSPGSPMFRPTSPDYRPPSSPSSPDHKRTRPDAI